MDLALLERAFAATPARTLLVGGRVLRRVVKAHRHLPGLGLQVPHARCYALPRQELLDIADEAELGRPASELPDHVVLVARPDRDDTRSQAEITTELWRYAFHASVHAEMARLAASNALGPSRVRERIHRVGQTEFDEIRLVLRQDGLLLAHGDDLETYTEFVALYVELSRFDPSLLAEMFPDLGEAPTAEGPLRVSETIALDLDVAKLLEATRPAGATLPSVISRPAERAAEEQEAIEVAATGPQPAAVTEAAEDARRRGNHVRAMLLSPEGRGADARALAELLDRAVHASSGAGDGLDVEAWTSIILALARRADGGSGLLRPVSARFLFDLQRAGIEGAKAVGKVDLVAWVTSLGRTPLARLLPATRELRVARELATAMEKIARVDLPEAQRGRLRELLAEARRRADASIRSALRPRLEEALEAVGIVPANLPEKVARAKVIEELLDQATSQGHLSLGQLRDAVSRNQLKMKDLAGPRELVVGDALLRADRRLASVLDGVHRGGEIYLRALQKVSSLLFGTRLGRFVTFFILVPVGGAYMVPFATQLVVTEVAHLTHLASHRWHPHIVPEPHHFLQATGEEIAIMIATGASLFGLIHSATVRRIALGILRAIGWILSGILFEAPKWVLSRPVVRAILRSAGARIFTRYLLRPGALAIATYCAWPSHLEDPRVALPLAGVVFVVSALVLNTRAGLRAIEAMEDGFMWLVGQLEHHLLPGLWRLLVGVFRRVSDTIDRGLYAVDEWLRFREGQTKWAIAAKAVLGLFWFAFAYVLRIYLNLLLEPTVNPIKHVPTVTVAAKIMLPVDKDIAEALIAAMTPFAGLGIARLVAGLTVVSLPGFFGFLVWELKENYKLYRATRATSLEPLPIGHHGETMGALLKPGFHSGTLPKLWQKLRRAARKGDPAVEKHREALREVEEAVERFVDRELGAILAQSDRFRGEVHVERIALASNRVRVELARVLDGGHGAPCVLGFEEQSGYILASMLSPGWVAELEGDEVLFFENALAGLYHRAGVDLVREQIAAALTAFKSAASYDVGDEGLVVWPSDFADEIVYELTGIGTLQGKPRVGTASGPPLDRDALFFSAQSIAWTDWVEVWTHTPRRLVKGASLLGLLPPIHRREE